MAERLPRIGVDRHPGPLHSARPSRDIGRGEDRLLVLVLPTHGFTAPWPVLRFALDLPRGQGTDAVVVATRGGLKIGRFQTPGYEGTATLLVALILATKGYRIRGTAGVDMPSNWTALHPGLPPDAVGAIIDRARARTARLSDAVLSGGPGLTNWRASLLGLLLNVRSFNWLWTHTTPTHAYRLYREPGTTLAALDRRDEYTPET